MYIGGKVFIPPPAWTPLGVPHHIVKNAPSYCAAIRCAAAQQILMISHRHLSSSCRLNVSPERRRRRVAPVAAARCHQIYE